MTEVKPIKGKRIIPFDQPIKIALLFFHFTGFSIWYGGAVIGVEVSATFPVITVVSGMLLVIRELYKDGFIWLLVTEGALTIVKIVLLAVAGALIRYEVLLLSIVMLCGILSSHLPGRESLYKHAGISFYSGISNRTYDLFSRVCLNPSDNLRPVIPERY